MLTEYCSVTRPTATSVLKGITLNAQSCQLARKWQSHVNSRYHSGSKTLVTAAATLFPWI